MASWFARVSQAKWGIVNIEELPIILCTRANSSSFASRGMRVVRGRWRHRFGITKRTRACSWTTTTRTPTTKKDAGAHQGKTTGRGNLDLSGKGFIWSRWRISQRVSRARRSTGHRGTYLRRLLANVFLKFDPVWGRRWGWGYEKSAGVSLTQTRRRAHKHHEHSLKSTPQCLRLPPQPHPIKWQLAQKWV